MNEVKPLSRIDKKILRELQKDGRTSFAELARRVGLTTTPCMERVKRMERDGVIRGYTTLLDPSKLESALAVFVQIRLSRTSQNTFAKFKKAAMDLDAVQECYLVSGNFDYLIKARVADMNAYRVLLGETLLSLPGVQESTSYVVMEDVKETLNVRVPD